MHNVTSKESDLFVYFAAGDIEGKETAIMTSVSAAHKRAQENIAKMLKVADYGTLVHATQHESKSILAQAKGLKKHKAKRVPVVFSSGNPYIMLNRFMNNRGKAIR